ncbi:hypothetical protein DPMN_185140 [Dreissena polymorpha]|uniref:Uncharacterized protein n=1 Tax=Dreissena polymorpha TaxID=45954 RepID=A0A9D4DKD7_DREPO|nr:hypothetical protein DPMN_185140 [Dreissena polymorpha]
MSLSKSCCRYIESDTHVFSGKFCEVRVAKNKQASVEKLQLESKYIVAIATSVSGVIMIAAVVAIVCLVYRLRRMAAKDGDERYIYSS